MSASGSKQPSAYINRSFYSLLIVVAVVFVLVFMVLELQRSEGVKRDSLSNDYHLAVINKSLQLLSVIDKARLWAWSNQKNGQKSSDAIDELFQSPLHHRLTKREFLDSLDYEIDKLIGEIVAIENNFSDPEFKTMKSLLDGSYIKMKARLEESIEESASSEDFQFIDSNFHQKIDDIIHPLFASVHQLQRLHNNAYLELRQTRDDFKRKNNFQILGLVFIVLVIGYFGVLKIIRRLHSALSELTAAQTEIMQGKARFEAMFEAIPDTIIYADSDRKIRLVNRAAVKMFGYDVSDLEGNDTKLLYASSDDYAEQGEKRYNQQIPDDSLPYQITYRRKNGDEFEGETLAAKVNSSTGEALGYLGIIRDVSERVNVEAILRSLAEGASGLNLKPFMDNVLERLTILYDCQYAFVGSLTPDGNHIQTLAVRANGKPVENFQYALAGTPCQDMLDGKIELISQDAAQMYAEDTILTDMRVETYFGAPLITSDGSTIGLLTVMGTKPMWLDKWTEPVLGVFAARLALELERDITTRELQQHRERLEELVQERTLDMQLAREEAEQASAAKSEFLSSMSHELRTPLNAILGFGQLLELDDEGLNQTQRENVKEILEAGHHLLELINDVLDLAKIESGNLEVSMEEVQVDDLLKQSMTLVMAHAKARQVEIIDNISCEGHIVTADFTRLKQVLLNLLSNAVKYNRKSGRVTLDCDVTKENRLRICVTDTGKGLTENEIEKLFTSFERLNAVDNIEGTGIGLVISKHLIEMMGGSIGVESTPGKGSTFWIELALFDQS